MNGPISYEFALNIIYDLIWRYAGTFKRLSGNEVHVICASHANKTSFFGAFTKVPAARRLDDFLELSGTPAPNTPRMPFKPVACEFSDAHKVALTSNPIYLRSDCTPHQPFGRLFWRSWLTLDSHNRAHGIARRRPIPTKKNDGWGTVPRYLGARGAYDMAQIDGR